MIIELTRGDRFKDARTVHNRYGKQTLDEVASATGISKGNISAIENDKAGNIGAESVALLANHYGVSADWLLGLTPVHRPDTSLQAIGRYTGLSPASVERLPCVKTEMFGLRETLDRLLSADGFPRLLEALQYVEKRVSSAERVYQYSGLSGDNRALSLKNAKELLDVSVFRFAIEASNLCKSIYHVEETEEKLQQEAHNGEHTED